MPNWIGYTNPNCSVKVYCTGLYTMNQTVTLGVYCMLPLLLLSELELLHRSCGPTAITNTQPKRL